MNLISINVSLGLLIQALFLEETSGEGLMPIDAILLSLAICSVFALFAVILSWTAYRTTAWQKKQSAELPSVPSKKAA
jgi:hypothetical protein